MEEKQILEEIKKTNELLRGVIAELHLQTIMKFEKEKYDHLSSEEQQSLKEYDEEWWKLDPMEQSRLYPNTSLGDIKCVAGDAYARKDK